jgi:hypothetical protein
MQLSGHFKLKEIVLPHHTNPLVLLPILCHLQQLHSKDVQSSVQYRESPEPGDPGHGILHIDLPI